MISFFVQKLFTVLYRKSAKNDMRVCSSTELFFKSEFKNSRARFFSSQILLAEEIKRLSLARPVFNLKAMEFGAFFAYFHLFRHLKVIQPFQKYA